MSRVMMGIAALIAFVYSLWFFDVRHFFGGPHYGIILGYILPIILGLLGSLLLAAAFSRNNAPVKAGKVIGRAAVPGHHQGWLGYKSEKPDPASCPNGVSVTDQRRWLDPCWSLRIKDTKGRKSWVEVSEPIYQNYPHKSYYPGQ